MREGPAEYLTVGQVSTRWGVSRTHVQRLCDQGRLPCTRNPFGVRFITAADADRVRGEMTRAVPYVGLPPLRPRSPKQVIENPPKLFAVLHEQGRTQKWLATRLGVPPWRVSRYRRGLGRLDHEPVYHAFALLAASSLLDIRLADIISHDELAAVEALDTPEGRAFLYALESQAGVAALPAQAEGAA